MSIWYVCYSMSVIVSGIIIGIIAVGIFYAVGLTISNQAVTMSGNKLSPMINDGDLIRYEDVAITEIKRNDMVVYYEGSYRISKVTETGGATYGGAYIEVTDAAGFKHTVNNFNYEGKVSEVIPNAGNILNYALGFPNNLWLYIIIFISPMGIMKIRERGKK